MKWFKIQQDEKIKSSRNIEIKNKWKHKETEGYIIHYKYKNKHYVNHFPEVDELTTLYSRIKKLIRKDKVTIDHNLGIRIAKIKDSEEAVRKAEQYIEENPNGEEDYKFVYRN